MTVEKRENSKYVLSECGKYIEYVNVPFVVSDNGRYVTVLNTRPFDNERERELCLEAAQAWARRKLDQAKYDALHKYERYIE